MLNPQRYPDGQTSCQKRVFGGSGFLLPPLSSNSPPLFSKTVAFVKPDVTAVEVEGPITIAACVTGLFDCGASSVLNCILRATPANLAVF